MTRSAILSTALAFTALLATAAVAADKGDTTQGKKSYTAQCLICHGQAGDGAGPAGAALRPKPTDFTDAGWWEGETDASVMGAIKRGKTGTAMQAFPMAREDLEQLVAYLRSFEPEG